MFENRLAPYYGKSKTAAKDPSDPSEQGQEKLTRHTLSCPLTISTTTIFNMAVVEPLQKLMIQPELTEEHLAECRRVIYSLLSMENKGDLQYALYALPLRVKVVKIDHFLNRNYYRRTASDTIDPPKVKVCNQERRIQDHVWGT